MQYRLFFTDFDTSKANYEVQKSHLMTYAYNDLDDALGKARHIKAYGGVPWEIESEGGSIMDRAEIDRLLHVRAAALAGRPKIYYRERDSIDPRQR
jgi:hypothetical protein